MQRRNPRVVFQAQTSAIVDEMSTQKLHVGIIGAGRIGQVHAESLAFLLSTEARIVTITDINREAAQAAAARCAIPAVAESSAEILANPQIEAVLICSSTNTHADLIVEAATAGKHIFCEKPIAHSLGGQIERALAAVETAGVQLQIGFNRRFDANFAPARQAVITGEIGSARLLHIISRDPAPPPLDYIPASGGMFIVTSRHVHRDVIEEDVILRFRRGEKQQLPEFSKILVRLGWLLRRLERAAHIRRETAGAYLRAAGIAVRPPGGSRPKADFCPEASTRPVSRPSRSVATCLSDNYMDGSSLHW